MAYIGNSKVTLDPKSRLAVPSRYRESLLEQCEGQMTITRGPEARVLWLFPRPVWKGVFEELVTKPAADWARRRYLNNADDIDMDSGGRILIPNGLREKGILPNSSLAFVGNGTFFEIWDWETHVDNENNNEADPAGSAALAMSF